MENSTPSTQVRSICHANRGLAGRIGNVIDVDSLNKKLRVAWHTHADGTKLKRPFKGWIAWKNTEIVNI